MKRFVSPSRGILFLFILVPLVLAACGANPTENATKLIEAIEENDKGKAEDATCDDVHDDIDILFDLLAESDQDLDYDDIDCEEDGDNVECKVSYDGGEDTVVFEIEDGKVCGGDLFDDIRGLDDASADESTQDLPTLAPSN